MHNLKNLRKNIETYKKKFKERNVDFDIADLMADSNSSSMNHSTPNDASNISDNNSSNYGNIKLSDTGVHNRLSSNSLSIGGSPDMNANDFAIISGEGDDDDDLFSFLLD